MALGAVAGVKQSAAAWVGTFVVGILSAAVTWQTIRGSTPALLQPLVTHASPFGIANSYGLFATMTTLRGEIAIEGSNDGVTWKEYGFRYKPGDLSRRPPIAAPHQPRLDWQMWFAALSTVRDNPWFVNLMYRLLQGSPEVLKLFEWDPFAGKPPAFVRAQLYEYRFTALGSSGSAGGRDWWTRRLVGPYLPAVSLDSFERRER